MRKREIERFRVRLLREKERLKDELSKREKSIRQDAGGESGENVYSDHMADMALSEPEEINQILQNERELEVLREVENALLRIKRGTFGVCMRCGKTVEKERLNLIPYARYCIECKSTP